jgi:hypothetical protein
MEFDLLELGVTIPLAADSALHGESLFAIHGIATLGHPWLSNSRVPHPCSA